MMRTILLAAALTLAALPARAQTDLTEVTSPGGVDAWLVQEETLPFVALELRFEGGAALDPDGAEGGMNLMMALLDEGAGDLDAQAFAAAREDLAARFSFSASQDHVSVSARFLTENRDAAVDLLRSALVEPRFDADAMARVRAQVISGIRSDARDPNALASRHFDSVAFGDHPYGRPTDGTEDSVAALTEDDLIAAHQATLSRDRVHVGAAGDISADDLGAILDRLLGDLPAQGAPDPAKVRPQFDGGVTVVPFDGPQSVIRFGHEGLSRDDPDFIPAFVVNQVLGGGRFGTRLMRELRTERGLTYGVYTALSPMRLSALIQGRLSVGNSDAAETVELLREQWARLAGEGPTEEELDRIKTYLTGEFPLRFDGNASIAQILASFQSQGLPASYLEERNALVEAVTPEEARAVAARLFDPERLHFVVVGQPEGL